MGSFTTVLEVLGVGASVAVNRGKSLSSPMEQLNSTFGKISSPFSSELSSELWFENGEEHSELAGVDKVV